MTAEPHPLFCGTCGTPLASRPPGPGVVLCSHCLEAGTVDRITDVFAIRMSDLLMPPAILAQVQAGRAQIKAARAAQRSRS